MCLDFKEQLRRLETLLKSIKSEPMGVGMRKFTHGGYCTDVVRLMFEAPDRSR